MSLANGGGGGSLEIFRKIKELEQEIALLKAQNKNNISAIPVSIDAPPTGTTQIFTVSKAFSVANSTIPAYTKGIFISMGGDGVLIAVDIVGGNKLITAIKANGAWQNIRII